MGQAAGAGVSRPVGGGALRTRNRQMLLLGGAAVMALILTALVFNGMQTMTGGVVGETPTSLAAACQPKPFRHEQAAELITGGAVLAYERNGGPECIDELYAVYADGRIVGDDGTNKVEKQVAPDDVAKLLADIRGRGWFTDEMYDTWHKPCGQCFEYYIAVADQNQVKIVKAVDGGTDAPANYWQVVSLINGAIPKIAAAP
jgi:hypothetical protein